MTYDCILLRVGSLVRRVNSPNGQWSEGYEGKCNYRFKTIKDHKT